MIQFISIIICIVFGVWYYKRSLSRKGESMRDRAVRKFGEDGMKEMIDQVSDPEMKSLYKKALDIEETKPN